jgi:hypothetical protein
MYRQANQVHDQLVSPSAVHLLSHHHDLQDSLVSDRVRSRLLDHLAHLPVFLQDILPRSPPRTQAVGRRYRLVLLLPRSQVVSQQETPQIFRVDGLRPHLPDNQRECLHRSHPVDQHDFRQDNPLAFRPSIQGANRPEYLALSLRANHFPNQARRPRRVPVNCHHHGQLTLHLVNLHRSRLCSRAVSHLLIRLFSLLHNLVLGPRSIPHRHRPHVLRYSRQLNHRRCRCPGPQRSLLGNQAASRPQDRLVCRPASRQRHLPVGRHENRHHDPPHSQLLSLAIIRPANLPLNHLSCLHVTRLVNQAQRQLLSHRLSPLNFPAGNPPVIQRCNRQRAHRFDLPRPPQRFLQCSRRSSLAVVQP